MKGKLHKMESGYILSLNGDIDDPYAIVNKELAEDYEWYKLSLKNCQAIELGYDLDGLVENFWKEEFMKPGLIDTASYKEGFKKALEILGDKKFSINEVVELCKILMSNPFEKCGKTYQELTDSYIQSLQQTEWDVTFNPDEKDSDNCLILKRL